MKRPLFGAAVFLCLLAAWPALRAFAAESPLNWVNRLRASAGDPALQEDELLSRTALDWAQALARAGTISHRGSEGDDALNRYRSHGGTEVRVGEIIGAGPRLAAIEKAWEASPSHRALVLRRYWTHAGIGESPDSRGGEVCVILFCEKLVDDLELRLEQPELLVAGRFTSRRAVGALLLAGLQARRPQGWDPASRAFVFRLGSAGIPRYLRLGFVAAEGGFTLTNVFTLPRETGSPANQARSSTPGERP
jgi:Cysteine-rich secretory protein family